MNRASVKLKALQKEGRKYLLASDLAAEKEIIKIYKEGLKAVRMHIALVNEKYGEGVTLAEMQRSYKGISRLKMLESEIGAELKALSSGTKSIIGDTMKTAFADQYNWNAFSYEKVIGKDLGFAGLDKQVIQEAMDNPQNLIEWQNYSDGHVQDLNRILRQEISKQFTIGAGTSQVAADFRALAKATIKAKFEQKTYEAVRIMRTETSRVRSEARVLAKTEAQGAAERLGIKMVEVWDAFLGGLPKHRHSSMNGQQADENGEFTLPSGLKTRGPSLSGDPGEDINCQCDTHSEILESEEIESSDINQKEWAENKGVEFKGKGF